MNIRTPTTPEYLALIIIIIMSVALVMSEGCHNKEVDVLSNQLSIKQAELMGYELIENENVSLRKLLLQREQPIVLVKPEYVVTTRIQTVEKEIVKEVPMDCSQPNEYTYAWSSGLPVAHYSFDGYTNTHTTGSVVLDVETEVDEEFTAVQVYATSSLLPSERFLLQSSTQAVRVEESALERLSIPPWVYVASGFVGGVALTASSVKLAGELD